MNSVTPINRHFSNNGTSYLQYQGTDPITKNSMTIRSDGLIRVNRLDEGKLNEVDQVDRAETNICQFPDGTRVTRNNAETRIENPLYPLVIFEEDGKKALVILSNGSVIQVESNGNYHVTSSSGGSFAVGQDGTVLFTSKQDGASTHIVRQKSNSILGKGSKDCWSIKLKTLISLFEKILNPYSRSY